MLGLKNKLFTASKVALLFIENGLKAFFDFNSSKAKVLRFVGQGSFFNSGAQADFIEIPGANFQTGADTSFTVMFWFRSDSDDARTFMSLYDNSVTGGWQITCNGPGRIFMSTNDTSGNTANYNDANGDTTASSDGKWHHLACIVNRDTDVKTQYLDGIFDRSREIASILTMYNSEPLTLFNNN